MAELQGKFNKIVSDIEKNLQNKQDVEYVKKQISKMYNIFNEELDRLEKKSDSRVESLLIRYKVIEDRIQDIEDAVGKIEEDIYINNDENEDYEFDITCPYCDSEFSVDLSEGTKNKVICPECNQTIELDWNEENSGCGHNCSGCANTDCGSYEDDEMDDDM